MERSLYIYLLLLLLLTTTLTSGRLAENSEDHMVKRLLTTLRKIDRWGPTSSCRWFGQECKAMASCCDPMACYYKDGFTLKKGGVCVNCVKEGQICQRDGDCCHDLQCNSGNALWIDGMCERYRRSGPCYRDGQCVNKCVKEWYQTHGECS